MPTYQYACTDCDYAFEQVQSFTDDSLTTCPQCEGRLRKIFNAVGVVFKGSGFYRTDSRSDQKSSGGKGASGSGASTPDNAGSGDSASSTTTSSESSSTAAKPAKPAKGEAGAA